MLSFLVLGCPAPPTSVSPPPTGAPEPSTAPTPTAQPLPMRAVRVGSVAPAVVPLTRFGDTVYGTSPAGLFASTGGETFHPLPGWGFGLTTALAVSPMHLFAASAGTLHRSADSGRTFAPVPVPFDPPGGRLALATTANGTLWVVQNGRPDGPAFARSMDAGATFTPFTVPHTWQGGDVVLHGRDALVVVVDDTVLHSLDGDTWSTLGTFPFLSDVHETDDGTVVLAHRELNDWLHVRWEDGHLTTDVETRAAWYDSLDDGSVVRLFDDGRLQSRADDDAPWTQHLDGWPQPGNLNAVGAVLATADGLLVDVDQQHIRWRPGATSWDTTSTTGVLPASLRVLDVAIASDAVALLGERNNRAELFVSDDAGATWTPGERFDTRYTAVAIAPDGQRIFVGGPAGRTLFLQGDGFLPPDHPGTPSSITAHGIRQAIWTRGDPEYLLVTAGDDSDTDGALMRSTPNEPFTNWTALDPYTDPGAPQRGNPASFYGVESSDGHATVGAIAFLGGQLREHDQLVSRDWAWATGPTRWDEIERPVAYGVPLSLATSTSDACRQAAALYADDQLFFGHQPVRITDGAVSDMNDVACGPDGSTWVASDRGLYRLLP